MRYLKEGLCWSALVCALTVTIGSFAPVAAASPGQNPAQVDPRDLQMLAILYIQENQPNEALPLLERAIDLYPENGETHMWYGVALLLTEQLDPAEEAFMRALSRNPGLTDARNWMGLLRYKQGDLDAAVREFREALLDPAYPPTSKARVRLNLGRVYLELGAPEAAREQLSEGIAIGIPRSDPNYPLIHVLLARSLTDLGRTQEAIAALLRALETDENHVEARLLLGLAYRDLGQTRVAREHLEKVVELAPGTEFAERAQVALARLQG